MSSALQPGERYGEYEILDRLGQGGFGTVYKVRSPRYEAPLALKLSRDPVVGTDAVQRALREVTVLRELNNPYVVGILDCGLNPDSHIFVLMEFLDGKPLDEFHQFDDILAPKWACHFVYEICQGLKPAHAKGIVHRDIKPANILIGADGRAKVGDFGLAQLEADATTEPRLGGSSGSSDATRFGGTPMYMAPEQHLGAIADAQSDQYSLAATAWETLTGSPPFRGRSLAALAEAKLDGQPHSEIRLSGGLRRVLLRGLSPDPGARFGSVEAFVAALRRASQPRKRRWPIAALVVGGVAAFALCDVEADRSPCQELSEPAWDADVSTALKTAFHDGGIEEGEGWTRVERAADAYTQGWARTRDVACSRTPPAQQQLACLQRSSQAFEQTMARLSANPKLALDALAAIDALPETDCQPDAAAVSPQSRQVSLAIAELRLLEHTGQVDDRDALLGRVEPLARELDNPALLARILEAKGALLADKGAYEPGVAALEEGYSEALRAGDERAALSLATDIIDGLNRSEGSAPRVRYWLELGHVAHARLEHAPSVAAAWLYIRQSEIEWVLEGDAEQATQSAEHALEIANALDPSNDRMVYLARAAAEQSLVDIGVDEGRSSEMGVHAEAVVANTRAAFGEGHPQTLDAHYALVGPRLAAHREAEALEALEKSRRGTEILSGARSESMVGVLAERSRIQLLTGDFEGALSSANESLEIARAIAAPPWLLSSVLSAKMLALKAADDLGAARTTSAELITLIEGSMGPDHVSMALAQHNFGDLLFATGDFAEAITAYTRSLRIATATFGDDSPNLSYPLSGLAEAHLLLREFELARKNVDRARAVDGPDAVEQINLARLDWIEARLIREVDPTRAEELARDALGRYRDAGYPDEAAKIEAWLGER